jgi:hypothetical protein
MLSASAQIVREIYCFRTDVCEYDPRAAASSGGDGAGEEAEAEAEAGGADPTPFNAREVFVRRYQEINKFALDQVGDDSLRRHANSFLDLNQQSHKDVFKQRLRKYVPKEVLNGFQKVEGAPEMASALSKWFTRCLCGKPKYGNGAIRPDPNSNEGKSAKKEPPKPAAHEIPDELEAGELPPPPPPAEEEKKLATIEPDDFVSPCTIETYIEYRSKQLLNLCEAACPGLAKRLGNLEMLIIFAGAAGTLISALGYPRWVALTVSAASVLMNVMQHEMLQQRLSSCNSAIRELRNMKVHMDSLSIVSKRTQEMKTLCVNTVETAVLETTTSWTGISARPSAQVAEGGGSEGS